MASGQKKKKLLAFDWDEGNRLKNWIAHKVTLQECEEVFFIKPLHSFEDTQHSQKEERFLALGKTNKGRKLTIIYTIRKDRIRIISARNQSKKERRFYETS